MSPLTVERLLRHVARRLSSGASPVDALDLDGEIEFDGELREIVDRARSVIADRGDLTAGCALLVEAGGWASSSMISAASVEGVVYELNAISRYLTWREAMEGVLAASREVAAVASREAEIYLLIALYELSLLVSAGVPLPSAVQIAQYRAPSERTQSTLREVAAALEPEGGAAVQVDESMPEYLVRAIMAGAELGALDAVLVDAVATGAARLSSSVVSLGQRHAAIRVTDDPSRHPDVPGLIVAVRTICSQLSIVLDSHRETLLSSLGPETLQLIIGALVSRRRWDF